MSQEIILRLNEKGWDLIERILLQLPGANGVHEFIEELRQQVIVQKEIGTTKNSENDE